MLYKFTVESYECRNEEIEIIGQYRLRLESLLRTLLYAAVLPVTKDVLRLDFDDDYIRFQIKQRELRQDGDFIVVKYFIEVM